MAANGEQEPVYDIPKECKAGVVIDEGPNFRVEVQMVPVPEPAPDEVLVKLNATGLCASDIHCMAGTLRYKLSDFGIKTPGHEGAGVIVKKGANVKRLKVGQRAGVKALYYSCEMCEYCWNSMQQYCSEAIYSGVQTTGTYQQYVVIQERHTILIPDGVADFVAGPIMCSGATMYRSIKESNLKSGQWAVFPGGGGGVGIQGVQLAHAMGMRPIVIDTGSNKKEIALKMGAVEFIDFKETKNVSAEVIRICDGKGPHGVFITAPAAYENALDLLGSRAGATIMCVGIPEQGTATIGGDPIRFIGRNFTVKGTSIANMGDTAAALEYAKRGLLKQICEIWPIDKLPEAIEKLKASTVPGRIVIDFNA